MGGISANTGGQTLYGTNGYLLVGGTDIGATMGDFTVEWGYETYYPKLAQAQGFVAGTGKVTAGFFRLKCTIAEFDYTNLSKFLGTITADSSGSSEKFGGAALLNVTELTNVELKGMERNDGKDVLVSIPSAYVEIGDLKFSKEENTTLDLTFHGLFAAASPTTLPGHIQIEK